MKKIYLFLLFATISGAAMAQLNGKIVKQPCNEISVIPQAFSYGGKVTIGFTKQSMGDITSITLVDEFLNDKKTITPANSTFISFGLMDWRSSFGEKEFFYLSQTLFNDDETIEYAVPVTGTQTKGIDWDGDGVIDDTRTYEILIGFNVVSEDGTVLQEVMFDENFTTSSYNLKILLMGDKCYLMVGGECDGEAAWMIYDIKRKTNNVTKCDVNADGAVDVADIATIISEMSNR